MSPPSDLTDEEVSELGPLIRDVSRAAESATGCAKTYVAQFAEHPDHPHVDVHVIPRLTTLEDKYRGPRIFDLLGLAAEQCASETRMDDVAGQIAASLTIAGSRWMDP